MKPTHLKLIGAVVLAALLLWGGSSLFFGHRRGAEKRDADQMATSDPVPQLASSSSIPLRGDGNAVGVVTLYSILFSSIAEQNRPGSRSRPSIERPTEPENPHRLPEHGR